MSDTSTEAARVQAEIHRRLSGNEKLAIAFEMSEMARELARSRLRTEHPEWSGRQVTDELIRIALVGSSSFR